MNDRNCAAISRREFARRAAVASAASLVSANKLPAYAAGAEVVPQQPSDGPALSAEGQAESEARYQSILASYSSRFSDAQKADLRRLCFAAQPSVDHLRAYALENGSTPALYLKPLIEREKKPEAAAIPREASQPVTKP